MVTDIPAYPRTLHLGRSGGGTSKHSAAIEALSGAHLAVEEKVDGSHVGLFFDEDANLVIFHRNSRLDEPPSNPEFKLLHRQARLGIDALWDALQTRFVLYGEWALHTHSLFYDALPAYFLEDDVFDRQRGAFLATAARRHLRSKLPDDFSSSVEVLAEGDFDERFGTEASITELIGPSRYRSSNWESALAATHDKRTGDLASHTLAEGLYIKDERNGIVTARYKWVRESFITSIKNAESHWRSHKPLQNQLRGRCETGD